MCSHGCGLCQGYRGTNQVFELSSIVAFSIVWTSWTVTVVSHWTSCRIGKKSWSIASYRWTGNRYGESLWEALTFITNAGTWGWAFCQFSGGQALVAIAFYEQSKDDIELKYDWGWVSENLFWLENWRQSSSVQLWQTLVCRPSWGNSFLKFAQSLMDIRKQMGEIVDPYDKDFSGFVFKNPSVGYRHWTVLLCTYRIGWVWALAWVSTHLMLVRVLNCQMLLGLWRKSREILTNAVAGDIIRHDTGTYRSWGYIDCWKKQVWVWTTITFTPEIFHESIRQECHETKSLPQRNPRAVGFRRSHSAYKNTPNRRSMQVLSYSSSQVFNHHYGRRVQCGSKSWAMGKRPFVGSSLRIGWTFVIKTNYLGQRPFWPIVFLFEVSLVCGQVSRCRVGREDVSVPTIELKFLIVGHAIWRTANCY